MTAVGSAFASSADECARVPEVENGRMACNPLPSGGKKCTPGSKTCLTGFFWGTIRTNLWLLNFSRTKIFRDLFFEL